MNYELFDRYPVLSQAQNSITMAGNALIDCFKNGHKLFLCGNGGSSTDCEHISAELMKGFCKKRSLSQQQKSEMKNNFPSVDERILLNLQNGLCAIPLSSFSALNTAYANDVDAELIFAQSVNVIGNSNDILLCISTSGNSSNIIFAAETAKAKGMKVVSLTGQTGGKLKEISDICICVPESETYKIQELHMPIYHYLCLKIENALF